MSTNTKVHNQIRCVAVVALAVICSSSCTIRLTETPPVADPTTAVEVAPTTLPIPELPTSPVPPVPEISDLQSSFSDLALTLDGSVGLAIVPVGTADVTSLGDWTTGVSWSTIKVPLAIAALRESGDSAMSSAQEAIEQSNNASAEDLWSMLGEPSEASTAVTKVLSDAGDSSTDVESRHLRAGFSAFGQTVWSLSDQATFTARLPCIDTGPLVLNLMRNVIPEQQWGLANLNNAAIKGGWGPDDSGSYLVRQIAVVDVPSGQVAISVAALPSSGTFSGGIALLDKISAWLQPHLDAIHGGSCPPF